MPNWAEGVVVIRGHSSEDIQKFVLHFSSDFRDEILIQAGMDSDYPRFARSFLNIYGPEEYMSIIAQTNHRDEDERGCYRVCLSVNFAWSASCCILPGKHSYLDTASESDRKGLISVMDAVKKHNVWIEIFTEEPGMCFQEHILVNNLGEIVIDEALSISNEETEDGEIITIGGYTEDCDHPFQL